LQLSAHHRVRHRGVPEIAQRVLAGRIGIRRLALGVINVRAGVADGATPLVVPGVVEEDDGADDRNGLAEDGPYRPPVGVASFAPIRKALRYARISRRGSRAPQRGGQLTVCWAAARCCQKRRKPPSASWTPLATQPAGSRKAVSGAATRGEHRQRLGASATPSRVQCTKGVSIRSTTSVSTPWSTNRQPQPSACTRWAGWLSG
jgi:hypothetical protein